jgi:hypothetical protein
MLGTGELGNRSFAALFVCVKVAFLLHNGGLIERVVCIVRVNLALVCSKASAELVVCLGHEVIPLLVVRIIPVAVNGTVRSSLLAANGLQSGWELSKGLVVNHCI